MKQVSLESILKDVMSVEEDFAREWVPIRTTPINEMVSSQAQNLFKELYAGPQKLIGTLYNALYTEQKMVFQLNFDIMHELIIRDSNCNRPEITPGEYENFINDAQRKKLFKAFIDPMLQLSNDYWPKQQQWDFYLLEHQNFIAFLKQEFPDPSWMNGQLKKASTAFWPHYRPKIDSLWTDEKYWSYQELIQLDLNQLLELEKKVKEKWEAEERVLHMMALNIQQDVEIWSQQISGFEEGQQYIFRANNYARQKKFVQDLELYWLRVRDAKKSKDRKDLSLNFVD